MVPEHLFGKQDLYVTVIRRSHLIQRHEEGQLIELVRAQSGQVVLREGRGATVVVDVELGRVVDYWWHYTWRGRFGNGAGGYSDT